MKMTTLAFPFGVALLLASCALLAAQDAEPVFNTQPALTVKKTYDDTMAQANLKFNQELDVALKRAMQFNQLEEANTITTAKKQIADKVPLDVKFQSPMAQTAEKRYRQMVVFAERNYLKGLDAAQKLAMASSNLEEANAINAVREKLTEAGAGSGQNGETGLTLDVTGKPREVWQNTEAVTLPGNPASIKIAGTLILPSNNVKNLRIRSAIPNGSERLQISLNGKKQEFVFVEGEPRHVAYEPSFNADRLRIELGDPMAANQWFFGPLQWSINNGAWKDIPSRNLLSR